MGSEKHREGDVVGKRIRMRSKGELNTDLGRRAFLAGAVGWGFSLTASGAAALATGNWIVPRWDKPSQLNEAERQRRDAEIEADKKLRERLENRVGKFKDPKDGDYWARVWDKVSTDPGKFFLDELDRPGLKVREAKRSVLGAAEQIPHYVYEIHEEARDIAMAISFLMAFYLTAGRFRRWADKYLESRTAHTERQEMSEVINYIAGSQEALTAEVRAIREALDGYETKTQDVYLRILKLIASGEQVKTEDIKMALGPIRGGITLVERMAQVEEKINGGSEQNTKKST
jgi:hypothetical protein